MTAGGPRFTTDAPQHWPNKFSHPADHLWQALYSNLRVKDIAFPVLHCNNTTVEITSAK
jgi:hypothetical protein